MYATPSGLYDKTSVQTFINAIGGSNVDAIIDAFFNQAGSSISLKSHRAVPNSSTTGADDYPSSAFIGVNNVLFDYFQRRSLTLNSTLFNLEFATPNITTVPTATDPVKTGVFTNFSLIQNPIGYGGAYVPRFMSMYAQGSVIGGVYWYSADIKGNSYAFNNTLVANAIGTEAQTIFFQFDSGTSTGGLYANNDALNVSGTRTHTYNGTGTYYIRFSETGSVKTANNTPMRYFALVLLNTFMTATDRTNINNNLKTLYGL